MRHRLRREQKGIIFLVIIIIMLLSLVGVFYFFLHTDPVKENLKSDPIVKTLIVVTDGDKAIFTDVFIYYPDSGKGALIAIPGNTGGIYQSLNRVDRIDSIYAEKGIETYRKEIQRFINLDLSFTLRIDIEDFKKLTDYLGGMEVFIPAAIDARGENGEIWLLPSGAVSLDGDKTKIYMTYALEDEADGEIQERRQNMIVAFLSAIRRNKNTILQERNFNTYASFIQSDISSDDLRELISMISEVDTERLTLLEVTGINQNVDGKILLFPYRNGDFIKEVVQRAMTSLVTASSEANSRAYVIEIQNGTRVQGLARNTQILLQGAGFDVLNVSNAPSNDFEQTQIIDHIGNRDAARAVGDFIRCTTIIEESISDEDAETPNVDFTLILGRDFDGRYVHGQSASNAPEKQ